MALQVKHFRAILERGVLFPEKSFYLSLLECLVKIFSSTNQHRADRTRRTIIKVIKYLSHLLSAVLVSWNK